MTLPFESSFLEQNRDSLCRSVFGDTLGCLWLTDLNCVLGIIQWPTDCRLQAIRHSIHIIGTIWHIVYVVESFQVKERSNFSEVALRQKTHSRPLANFGSHKIKIRFSILSILRNNDLILLTSELTLKVNIFCHISYTKFAPQCAPSD